MSYILEALKKAEQERRLKRPKDVMEAVVDAPPVPARQKPWRMVAVLGVIALAGAGAWLAFSTTPERPAPKPIAQNNPLVTAVPPAPQPQPQAPPQSQPHSQARTEAPPSEASKPIATPTAPASPTSTQKPSGTAGAVGPQQATRQPSASVAPASEKPALKPSETKTKPEKREKRMPAAAESGEPDKSSPDPRRIYSINELPDEVRTSVPQLVISTHIYSTEPSERLVSINGNVLREGQELSKGVKVETIAPDGAILTSQGYRIKANLR